MSVENDFIPFAVGGSANVLTQAAYAALTTLTQNGFSAGIAPSVQLNKVWRQSSIMAAVIAQFIVAETGQTAIDDGTTATLLANLATAVGVAARQNPVLADTGTANAYAVANLAAFTAYPTVSGLTIDVSILNANTGASTINVDGLGTKPILGLGLQPLQGGELIVKGVACLLYIVASTVNSGNGAWILMECAGGSQQVAPATASQHAVQLEQVGHGQCRLSVASTTSLLLSPYNGNNVLVNGVPLQIPSAGVTISNGGLSASTLYYVYLGGTTASPTLTLSTTGHTTQPNGVTTQTGNAALTLVGMIQTDASTHFVDSQTSRLCLNWFNRRGLYCNAQGSGLTTSSSTLAELSTTLRCQFLAWADEAVLTLANGSVQNSTSGSCGLQGYLDSATFGITQSISFSTSGLVYAASSSGLSNQNEGMHTAQVYASTSSGTATWTNIQNTVQTRG